MDTLFFVFSKLIGALVRADTWMVIALAISTLANLRQHVRVAVVTSSATLLCLIMLSVLPLGDFLLQALERKFPANPDLAYVDGIIVLGGSEDV